MLTSDSQKLLSFLSQGKKLTAMVAPSFPVDFKKKGLIGALRALGFDKVCDHTLAIATVNQAYEVLFREKKDSVVIAANCPTTVNLIKTRFPSLVQYLPEIPSPMGANARLCQNLWPENLNVFIGPCLAKKIEAKKYPEVALVLTYREIKEILAEKKINPQDFEKGNFEFDNPKVKGVGIFPSSGGMKATIDLSSLGCRKVIVADGVVGLIKLFEELLKNPPQTCLFYDVLACPGGCLGGPGVSSPAGKEERKKRLLEYLEEEGEKPLCSEADLIS